MKREDFTPIGQTALTRILGNQPEDGNNAGRGGAVASPEDTQRVAAWLSRQKPRDMDAAAVSRASSHNVSLTVKSRFMFPVGENGERLPSYEIATGCEVSGTPEDIRAALADLRNFETPAPRRQIEMWLAELSVMVAKRQEDEFSEQLRVEAYASRLSQYPADVVRTVICEGTFKFWPTWDELKRKCDALASPRRSMIAALASYREPEPEPQRRAATDEEKARIAALVNEMFPAVSREWKERAVNEATSGNCMAKD